MMKVPLRDAICQGVWLHRPLFFPCVRNQPLYFFTGPNIFNFSTQTLPSTLFVLPQCTNAVPHCLPPYPALHFMAAMLHCLPAVPALIDRPLTTLYAWV